MPCVPSMFHSFHEPSFEAVTARVELWLMAIACTEALWPSRHNRAALLVPLMAPSLVRSMAHSWRRR